MVKELNISTVAEGVEREQVEFLKSAGDLIQELCILQTDAGGEV